MLFEMSGKKLNPDIDRSITLEKYTEIWLQTIAPDKLAKSTLVREKQDSVSSRTLAAIAVLVRQDDRAVFGGGNAVFCTLTGSKLVDKDCIREISLFAA